MERRMFFKVAVVSLLVYLALLHNPTRDAALFAGPPPAPMVVVVPAIATTTRVVDVRRADLEQAMVDPSIARIVPALHRGRLAGVKLYAIRPGSPLTAIGIQNGDTLRAINDVPITSADSVLEVYRAQREPDHYDLDIDRRGEPMRILVLVH
jgi:type II secretory pathway component PulC